MFVQPQTTERLPESRKLELNGYLTKPTTRLARYPLLLETILKYTPEGNSDKEAIPKAVEMIRALLVKVNFESGRSEARFNLAQLDQQLIFKPGEAVDLKLRDELRDLIFKGPLKKRGGTNSDSADLQVYLFDHAILMVKTKAQGKANEQLRVYRKPIPLELLVVSATDDPTTLRNSTVRPKSLMSRSSNASKLTLTNGSALKSSTSNNSAPDPTSKQGFPLSFTHLGRKGYSLTLWSPSWAGRKKWLDKIEQRQAELRDRSLVFDMSVLSEGFFSGTNRVTCAAPFGKLFWLRILPRIADPLVTFCRRWHSDGLWYRQWSLSCSFAGQREVAYQSHRCRQCYSSRRFGGVWYSYCSCR